MKITESAAWLHRSRVARDAWWALPPEQFRLAIWLLSVAKEQDGALRFSCTLDDVARHMACARGKLRRQLSALEKAGFCDVFGQRGRGGMTLIVIRDLPGPIPKSTNPGIDRSQRSMIAGERSAFSHVNDRPPDPGRSSDPVVQSDHLQHCEITGSGSHDLLGSPKISDPDLGSDLRSTDLDDLSNNTELNLQGVAIWVRLEATEVVIPQSSPPANPIIQERAWLAADYLRGQILAEDRTALVGSRPWSAEEKNGLRLAWASEFRSLHGRVLRALRNETPSATEAAAWDLIAKTVHWLFHGQPPGGPRFEVESPRSLAKKWDSIQRNRRRQAAPTAARGVDNRPDPMAARKFERW